MTSYDTELNEYWDNLLLGLLGTQPNSTCVKISTDPRLDTLTPFVDYSSTHCYAIRKQVDQLDHVIIIRKNQ